jgi:cytochrome c-type biogenesis protein CcmH/NrfF
VRLSHRSLRAAAVAVALLGLWAAPAAAGKPETKDPARAITSQLICPCSCGEILSGCTCETGKAMQGYVESELKAGKGKEQIEAALVAKYGEVIRGAPKAKGFNLVVWVAPFIATLVGFAIAALVLQRWVRRRDVPVPASSAGGAGAAGGAGSPTSAEESIALLRARAEAELKRLRE